MKITVNLSPFEINKLGKLTKSDFENCWNMMAHTEDDVCFAIHRLINMLDSVEEIITDDIEDYELDDNENKGELS